MSMVKFRPLRQKKPQQPRAFPYISIIVEPAVIELLKMRDANPLLWFLGDTEQG